MNSNVAVFIDPFSYHFVNDALFEVGRYIGAPDIADFIREHCFIDMRQFDGYSELKGYLKSLTDKEIRDYRERGKAFVNSPGFHPFTKEYFTALVARIVEEDTGIPLCNR